MRPIKFPAFLFLILLGVAGCWKQGPGKRGVLSINEMKLVLWDVMQADEFAVTYIPKDSTLNLERETNRLYQKVFLLHKTDSAQFFKSFDYYRNHPDHYRVLIDSLQAYSNRERDNRFYLNQAEKVAPE